MNEKIELKPCPRCAAGVSIIRAHGAKWVSCRCGIQSSRYGEHIDDERMIRDWDYRPVEDAQAARIEELERLVDDLRGELAQSYKVDDILKEGEASHE